MEIRNLSDAEFKTLVIRMLRELTEYSKHIKEEMKATLSEIKKNPQETNSEGKESRVQINDLEHKEEINKINSQPVQNEKTKIQENKERIRIISDISKHANIQIMGCQEEKRESKKLKTYLKT